MQYEAPTQIINGKRKLTKKQYKNSFSADPGLASSFLYLQLVLIPS